MKGRERGAPAPWKHSESSGSVQESWGVFTASNEAPKGVEGSGAPCRQER